MNEANNSNLGEYLLIGLTGSIGAGKSLVADIFRESGIPVLSADAIAKELMRDNAEMKSAIIAEFGSDVYTDGELNRKALANLVFNDREQLEKLNVIVHPRTIAEQGVRAKKLIEEGSRIVACEAALIFESGGDERFDYIVVVDADPEIRYRRGAERDGIDPEEVRKRDLMQIPAEEKVKRADFVITNNGSIEELREKTNIIVDLLKVLPPHHSLDEWDDMLEDGE
ncbi:MAG: dephospho-CoA kinase [Ignavibacteriae bacterium]|nr:dephospho-CoA kinase [Ignavibacteriota bacterium]MCB9216068.1 dephospho-CoA kinase [Ignavibacteria bacterium]